jgi:hypothetical protein
MLELLLLLQRDRQSSWSGEALGRVLRGKVELQIQNLGLLITVGPSPKPMTAAMATARKRPNSRRWSPLSPSFMRKSR